MNTAKATDGDFGEFSTARLAQQLDALSVGLGVDDDEGDENDPMNISDFLNSNGDLTGLSEWSDPEQDEFKELAVPKNLGTCAIPSIAEKPVVLTRLTGRGLTPNSNLQLPCSPHRNSNTTVSSCCPSTIRHNIANPTHPPTDHYHHKTPDHSRGRMLSRPHTEQIFTRAPNFRSPGGYKPPLVEKEPRNLTSEQLFQEVKEMYAEDRHLHAGDVPDSIDQDKDSLEFLTDPQFRRKAQVISEEEKNLIPVEEPLVTKSKAWVCNHKDIASQDSLVEPPTNSSGIIPTVINAPRPNTSERRSPNSRKENLTELSRLWDEIQDTKQRLEHDMNSLVNPVSSDTSCTVEDNHRREVPVAYPQPQSLPQSQSAPNPRRILSVGKRAFAPEPPVTLISRERTGDAGDTADVDSPKSLGKVMPKRNVRRTKGKRLHWRQGAGSVSSVPFKPRRHVSYVDDEFVLNQDDVDEILQETDIQESELDDLLSEISDYVPDVGVSGITAFFKHPDFRRVNEDPNKDYKQQYFEERYRRDHCENEISRLQKELLEVNEKVSVSDGIIRGMEATITKLNKVYQRVHIQWKSHEKGCKEELTQIKAQNAQLRGRLTESREQISAYEEELEKAIELSENFKAKVQLALEDLEVEKIDAKEQKEQLEEQMRLLKSSLATAQGEKESALRSLCDCHESLTVAKKSLADTTAEVQRMRVEHNELESKLQGLVKENQALESQLSEIQREKSELTSKFAALEGEFVQLKGEKVTVESEGRRKLKEEREKLHDYYNTKIKEILHTESQKMIEAEREFVKLHEEKLEQMQAEAEERLGKMRTKFNHQSQQMKSKFDAQLDSLRKENEDQAKLIGTVAQQLRNFSERDEQHGQGEKRDVEETLTGTSCHNSISSLVEALSVQRGWVDLPQSQATPNSKAPTS